MRAGNTNTRHRSRHATRSPSTAVADADRHGAEHVAVLAVSHADCEDLADRIRIIRAARGELRGPTLQGPGWGPAPRVYAAGDRILVHTNLGRGPDRRVFNGTTGTLCSVGTDGATVLLDHGRPGLPVRGNDRRDPPRRHTQRFSCVGAHRRRRPRRHLAPSPPPRHPRARPTHRLRRPVPRATTHPHLEHPPRHRPSTRAPRRPTQRPARSSPPRCAALIARPSPPTTTPGPSTAQLRTERDQHAAIVATRPSDQHAELEHARAALAHADTEHHAAVDALDVREHERARLGPLTRLRRGGRDDITRADQALAGAQRRLTRATTTRDDAHARVERGEQAVAQRVAWDHQHHWRIERIAEIDHTLAHHWADVTLRAVHADDPLAFGTQTLRAAAATYLTDLQHIMRGMPDNANDALTRAQTDLRRHQDHQRDATQAVADTRATLEHLNNDTDIGATRLPSLPPRAALHTAEDTLAVANAAVRTIRATGRRPTTRRQDMGSGIRRDRRRTHPTHPGRQRPLRRPRPHPSRTHRRCHDRPHPRALGNARPTAHTLEADSPPGAPSPNNSKPGTTDTPPRTTARSAQASAPRSMIDARSPPHPPDELSALLTNTADIIHTAGRLDPTPAGSARNDRTTWQATLETARRVLATERPAPQIEHDFGLEL